MLTAIKYIRWIAVLLVPLIITSCAKSIYDEPFYSNSKDQIEMKVTLNADKSGGEVDVQVKQVRVIIFNDRGVITYNKVQAASVGVVSDYMVTVEAIVGVSDFYVICNEDPSMTQKLQAITKATDLDQITVGKVNSVPLPMYVEVKGVKVEKGKDETRAKVTVGGTTYYDMLPVSATRLMSKLTFTVIKNTAGGGSDFTVESIKVKVKRIPLFSYMRSPKPYISTLWAADTVVTGHGQLTTNGSYDITGGVYTVPSSVDQVVFDDIYIPEHILTNKGDATNATYLEVSAVCQLPDGKKSLSIYYVNLGQTPPDDHTLNRNVHYKIYATIRNLGVGGLYAEIVPVVMHDIPINWKPIDGLVIVSDLKSDYDTTAQRSRNINVWSDYNAPSGVLKVYNAATGFTDVVFKYGSVVAIKNDLGATLPLPFVSPTSVANIGDVAWSPKSIDLLSLSSWAAVPHVSAGNVPIDNSKVAAGLGDPCKLAGLSQEQIYAQGIVDNKQWHMATVSEYELLAKSNQGFTSKYGFSSFGAMLLPNYKYRDASGILGASHNNSGHYWMNEAVRAFEFTSPTTTPSMATADPARGYTIRCVRNTIMETKLTASNVSNFSYQGDTLNGGQLVVSTNIAHWTAELIDSGPDAGTLTAEDFKAFSFQPGSTNVRKVTGSNTQTIKIYIKRHEKYSYRTFYVRLSGIGFDGVEISQIIPVRQLSPSLSITYSPTPLFYPTIPKAGQTYQFTLDFTPKDIPFPSNTKIFLKATFNNKLIGVSDTVIGLANKYVYHVTLSIPRNDTPDEIGIRVSPFVMDSLGYYLSVGPEINSTQSNK